MVFVKEKKIRFIAKHTAFIALGALGCWFMNEPDIIVLVLCNGSSERGGSGPPLV